MRSALDHHSALLTPTLTKRLENVAFIETTAGTVVTPASTYERNARTLAALGKDYPWPLPSYQRFLARLCCRLEPSVDDIVDHLAELEKDALPLRQAATVYRLLHDAAVHARRGSLTSSATTRSFGLDAGGLRPRSVYSALSTAPSSATPYRSSPSPAKPLLRSAFRQGQRPFTGDAFSSGFATVSMRHLRSRAKFMTSCSRHTASSTQSPAMSRVTGPFFSTKTTDFIAATKHEPSPTLSMTTPSSQPPFATRRRRSRSRTPTRSSRNFCNAQGYLGCPNSSSSRQSPRDHS